MEVIGIWILESECFFMLFVFNTDRCKVMHIGYELLTAYIMMSDGDNNSQFVCMCSRQAYENKISQKQPWTVGVHFGTRDRSDHHLLVQK